jgi:hypothetical protein
MLEGRTFVLSLSVNMLKTLYKLFLYIDNYKHANRTRLQGYVLKALQLVRNLQAASDNNAVPDQ